MSALFDSFYEGYGVGASLESNHVEVNSIHSIDLDTSIAKMQQSFEDLQYLNVYDQLSTIHAADKLRTLKKLKYATAGINDKPIQNSVESFINRQIYSIEEGEAATGSEQSNQQATPPDTGKEQPKTDGAPNNSPKEKGIKAFFKRIGEWFRQLWNNIKRVWGRFIGWIRKVLRLKPKVTVNEKTPQSIQDKVNTLISEAEGLINNPNDAQKASAIAAECANLLQELTAVRKEAAEAEDKSLEEIEHMIAMVQHVRDLVGGSMADYKSRAMKEAKQKINDEYNDYKGNMKNAKDADKGLKDPSAFSQAISKLKGGASKAIGAVKDFIKRKPKLSDRIVKKIGDPMFLNANSIEPTTKYFKFIRTLDADLSKLNPNNLGDLTNSGAVILKNVVAEFGQDFDKNIASGDVGYKVFITEWLKAERVNIRDMPDAQILHMFGDQAVDKITKFYENAEKVVGEVLAKLSKFTDAVASNINFQKSTNGASNREINGSAMGKLREELNKCSSFLNASVRYLMYMMRDISAAAQVIKGAPSVNGPQKEKFPPDEPVEL